MRPNLNDAFKYLWLLFFGTLERACATFLMALLVAPMVFMIPSNVCIMVGLAGWIWMISDAVKDMNDLE